MTLHKSVDHRTGITYVYDVGKTMDPETGKYVRNRHLVGRLDDDGNVVPTSGRRGRLPQKDKDVASNTQAAEMEKKILILKEENSRLKVRISELTNERRILVEGMKKLIEQADVSC